MPEVAITHAVFVDRAGPHEDGEAPAAAHHRRGPGEVEQPSALGLGQPLVEQQEADALGPETMEQRHPRRAGRYVDREQLTGRHTELAPHARGAYRCVSA